MNRSAPQRACAAPPSADQAAAEALRAPQRLYVYDEDTIPLVSSLLDDCPALADLGATHLVVAPQVSDIDIVLRGGVPLSVYRRESPYSDRRSTLRCVTLSGDVTLDQRKALFRELFAQPVTGEEVGPTLHLHVADLSGAVQDSQVVDEAGLAVGEEAGGLPLRAVEPRVGFDDILLEPAVRNRLVRHLDLARDGFRDLAPWQVFDVPYFRDRRAFVLNFSGPSGTGKTLTAGAVARHLGRSLLVVDYTQLNSKYVGDTEKNLRRVFEHAEDHGCVVLFDEADALLSKRLSSPSSAADMGANSLRAVMLVLLAETRVPVVFATNLIQNYDAAFRRRITEHFVFERPGPDVRRALLAKHLPVGVPGRDTLDLDALAEETDGFSGGDLGNVVWRSCVDLAALVRRRHGRDGRVLTAEAAEAALRRVMRINIHRTREEQDLYGKDPKFRPMDKAEVFDEIMSEDTSDTLEEDGHDVSATET